jgi:ABC-type multidrug transport system fused ATPase/permease subunit
MEDTSNYDQVGWFSYLSYSWMTPLMKKGARRQIALEDMPGLSAEEDTWTRTRELLHLLHHEERAGHSHPMLRALVRAHWPSLMMMQLLGIFQHCCGVLVPLLMKQVIVFQEAQEAQDKLHNGLEVDAGAAVLSSYQVSAGICAIFASLALGFFIMILNSQVDFFKARLGVRMGQALRGTVLARCVQGELPRLDTSAKSGSTAPAVYNVLSFDVAPLVDIIWIILGVWLFPIQFLTSMLALFHEVHYAIFPGLVTVLVAQGICGVLLFYDGRFRHTLLEAKDKRLNACGEAFNNIRTLQMLSWTGRFEEQILEARKEELRVKNLRLWMTKMVMALNYVLVALVTLVTLWYFVLHYSEGELKAMLISIHR